MHGLSKHRDSISILNKCCCQGKGCFLFYFFATKGTWALGLFGSGGNKHILGRMDSTSRSPFLLEFLKVTKLLLTFTTDSSTCSCIHLKLFRVCESLSCVWLCDPMDCSLPGSSVHGVLQARILEWVAIPFSRGSFWPGDWTWVSCIVGRFFTIWTTKELF